ncbi:hypothetical protein [Paraburkholderia sp. J94]|uniref:hypothetical protein n=1 Tax=Paraburkholderia sp. J94 TaxID=2805441 RepID=UPI002AAFC83B|nr:hypothetical protein [Paraburkholderia sp. J94]
MKRWKPEDWFQWRQDDWGGAELPIDPPVAVKAGAANRLTKAAVSRWLAEPFAGLWGVRIAADSLQQQRDVQKRENDRKAWCEHFAALGEKPEWPKGEDARNHTYWKWMEKRATARVWIEEQRIQRKLWAARERRQEQAYATDTHPWAGHKELRQWFEDRRFSWRDASVSRAVVYACHRTTRPGVEAWPMWMRPQQGGAKKKLRPVPTVADPNDDRHPQGRNKLLREVFEGLASIADQRVAVEVVTVATGSAPAWMVERPADPPKKRGRPRKQ